MLNAFVGDDILIRNLRYRIVVVTQILFVSPQQVVVHRIAVKPSALDVAYHLGIAPISPPHVVVEFLFHIVCLPVKAFRVVSILNDVMQSALYVSPSASDQYAERQILHQPDKPHVHFVADIRQSGFYEHGI